MNVPTSGDVFAAFFAGGHQAEPDPDEPVPFTLTDQAEAALDAGQPEPEASL